METIFNFVLGAMVDCLEAGGPPLLLLQHGKEQAEAKGTGTARLARFIAEAAIIGWCRGRGVPLEWPPT